MRVVYERLELIHSVCQVKDVCFFKCQHLGKAWTHPGKLLGSLALILLLQTPHGLRNTTKKSSFAIGRYVVIIFSQLTPIGTFHAQINNQYISLWTSSRWLTLHQFGWLKKSTSQLARDVWNLRIIHHSADISSYDLVSILQTTMNPFLLFFSVAQCQLMVI